MIKFCLIFLIMKLSTCEIIRPIINTPLGELRGSYYTSVTGRQYAAFEGIPYAKPPIKKYRFREPRFIKSWDGILDARFLYTCLQYSHYATPSGDRIIGDEDCLYLNVYTPLLNPIMLLDVIVYIHGGAFMFGSGHSYGEKIIMDRNVVYVNFNYRLGPFGFLSTEDGTVPGNNGLKDQVLALKWIRTNIQYFGGNPDSITLTGMSAGGASVHLHYMSPQSNGLFNRGFSLSGTALNPWVLQENALEKAKQLAASVDCDYNNNIKSMIYCLSHIPAKEIMKAMKANLFGFLYNPFSPFGVVIEPRVTINPFLPEHPYILLKNGLTQDLPWITSVVQSEGLYPASEFLSDPKHLIELERNWTTLATYILDYKYTNTDEQTAQKVKDFYLKGQQISKDTFNEIVQMVGDRLFVADSQLAARMQAAISTNPVYYYYFTYRGENSKSETLSKSKENFGASHGDDTVYVLSSNIDSLSTASDKKMSRVLLDLWTSYAKTGVPVLKNLTWKAVSTKLEDPLNYVEIESPDFVSESTSADFGQSDFWFGLKFKENQHLFPKVQVEL